MERVLLSQVRKFRYNCCFDEKVILVGLEMIGYRIHREICLFLKGGCHFSYVVVYQIVFVIFNKTIKRQDLLLVLVDVKLGTS